MEDKLLQAFVIFVSLLVSQKDNPSVEDESYTAVQEDNERMLRRMQGLDEEVAATDAGSPDEERPEPPGMDSERVLTEKAPSPDLEGSTVTRQDSQVEDPELELQADEEVPAGPDPSWPERPEVASETEPNTEELHNEVQTDGGLQADAGAEQTEGSEESAESLTEMEGSDSGRQGGGTPTLDRTLDEKSVSEGSEMLDGWEEGYLWYIWSLFSFFSTIRFFRKYIWSNLQRRRAAARSCTAAGALLPDSGDLHQFYSKHLQVPSHKQRRRGEFLDGFVNDLLGSMSVVCDKSDDMGIEGFEMVDARDIIVSIKPPKSYLFQCVWGQNAASVPDKGAHGQIKMMQMRTIQSGCQCQSPDADDMVCLLHSDNTETEAVEVRGGPLCAKNSPFLLGPQVSRWFQRALRQTWAQISHKYEFELSVGRADAPGALVVRFRSGERMSFNMSPVVKTRPDAQVYFCPRSSSNSDTLWTLSLAVYEDRLLDHLAKHLPQDSCHSQALEIAIFLHRRQMALTGSCALNETHFKTALLHLIEAKKPSQWKPNLLSCRLRDLLFCLERSLKAKSLHHALIGNSLAQCVELPAEFVHAREVNLLQPLVEDKCTYRNTVLHFQELLKNTHMLILEYTAARCEHTNGSTRKGVIL